MSCAVTPRLNTARYCTSRSGSAYRYDSSQAPADCQISPSDMSVVARINSAAASHIETYAAAASATEQPASMTPANRSTRTAPPATVACRLNGTCSTTAMTVLTTTTTATRPAGALVAWISQSGMPNTRIVRCSVSKLLTAARPTYRQSRNEPSTARKPGCRRTAAARVSGTRERVTAATTNDSASPYMIALSAVAAPEAISGPASSAPTENPTLRVERRTAMVRTRLPPSTAAATTACVSDGVAASAIAISAATTVNETTSDTKTNATRHAARQSWTRTSSRRGPSRSPSTPIGTVVSNPTA